MGLGVDDSEPITFRTSNGTVSATSGRTDGMIELTFKAGTPFACTMRTYAYVMEGVDQVYDVLVGTPLLNCWSVGVDPLSNLLEYYPFLDTRGDSFTMASFPVNKPVSVEFGAAQEEGGRAA